MGAIQGNDICDSDCTQLGAIINMIEITVRKNITGSRIKSIRLSKKLSQQDVDRIASLQGIDLTRSRLAKIETGMIRVTDETLRDLSIVFDVNVSEFFE
jgi:DNA primase large subunit